MTRFALSPLGTVNMERQMLAIMQNICQMRGHHAQVV
jgi:hypothetical protein